jgi:hypothetical protein
MPAPSCVCWSCAPRFSIWSAGTSSRSALGFPRGKRWRQPLPPRSALVGWLHATVGEYGRFDPEQVRFYAYVLRPGRPIVWVPLWSTHTRDEYSRALEGWRDLIDRLQRAASWRRHVDADPALGPAMRAWGKRNFEPLLPHLEGVDHLVMDRPMYPGELLTLADGRSVGERFGRLLRSLCAGAPAPGRAARKLGARSGARRVRPSTRGGTRPSSRS